MSDNETPMTEEVPENVAPVNGEVPDKAAPANEKVPDNAAPVNEEVPDNEGPAIEEVSVNEAPANEGVPDNVAPVNEEVPDNSAPVNEEVTNNVALAKEVVSKKEDILLKLNDIMGNTNYEELQKMTPKFLRAELTAIFGDEVLQFKAEIKHAISEKFLQLQPPQQEGSKDVDSGDDESNDEDDEEEGEEDDEEDEDEEHPDIAALPEEWKDQFGSVVWVKTKSFPWWPALLYNPSHISKALRRTALKDLGKRHAAYFYADQTWSYPLPKDIKPFSENLENFRGQTIKGAKYKTSFPVAIELAEKDLALPVQDRAAWNHKLRERTAKKAVSTDAKKSKATGKTSLKKATKVSLGKDKKKKVKGKSTESVEVESSALDETASSEEQPSEKESASEESEDEFDLEEDEEEEEEEEGEEYVADGSIKKKSKKRKSTSTRKDADKTKTKRIRKGDGDEAEAAAIAKKKLLVKEKKEERQREKKEKEKASQETKKRKASSVQPLTNAQKKKIIEEKNALEKSRISQMKNSSEPVWKQARASLPVQQKPAVRTVPQKPADETPLQRAIRLTKLIEVRIKAEEAKGAGQFDSSGIIKIMRKARNMELSLNDWATTKFIDLMNTLRKYALSKEIAVEAKEIRSYLKEKFTAMASGAAVEKDLGDTAPAPASDPVSTVEEHGGLSAFSEDPVCAISTRSKYYNMATKLLTSGNGGALSSEEANKVVHVLEKTIKPASSKENLSLFMSSVQKFSFALKDTCLGSLASSVWAEDEKLVARLALLPVSEWSLT